MCGYNGRRINTNHDDNDVYLVNTHHVVAPFHHVSITPTQIMAYGQTGSGKTYTMGSEAHSIDEETSQHGLIPRFMADVFRTLAERKAQADNGSDATGPLLLEYSVAASFLEVYGEDVHDLLDKDRKSLPLRDDSQGGVVIAGLTNQTVTSSREALDILHVGTRNRTTAATLMNLTSSRSHAVFTIYLTQTTRSRSGDSDLDMTSTAKFTFVDLAGSERMKKTGAEGERAREGIKINEGLLALGNVINALADEERLSKEKKVHVPYRQSKLTRLLQDALGGNSQTFFVACVSPADCNSSETLSTLHYANRARNIKNAPTKNVDGSVLELQQLRSFNHILSCELVKHRFNRPSSTDTIGSIDEDIFQEAPVQAYLRLLQETAEEKQEGFTGPVVSVSLAAAPSASTVSSLAASRPKAPFITGGGTGSNVGTPLTTINERGGANKEEPLGPLILDPDDFESEYKEEESILDEAHPDEDMAILDQLLDLQREDQQYRKQRKSDQEEQLKVQEELEAQEGLLLQLRDSLKVYQNLKEKYESLMGEVQQLEIEKTSLASQLEKVSADPSKGCSRAIKKKLQKVEANLARARDETKKHQKKYREAEQQAQKCRTLERKIGTLKQNKANLMKKQREAETKYRQFEARKRKEITSLKRKGQSAERKVTKLMSEIQIHKSNLEKRQALCEKLADQKKQTETHLMKLLSVRNRELRERTSLAPVSRRRSMQIFAQPTKDSGIASPSSKEATSMAFVLDTLISDQATIADLQTQYEKRIAEYGEIMRSLITEVNKLDELRKAGKHKMEDDDDDEQDMNGHDQAIEEQERVVEDLEVQSEVADSDAKELDARMKQLISNSSEKNARKTLSRLAAPVVRSLLWDYVMRQMDIEVCIEQPIDWLVQLHMRFCACPDLFCYSRRPGRCTKMHCSLLTLPFCWFRFLFDTHSFTGRTQDTPKFHQSEGCCVE